MQILRAYLGRNFFRENPNAYIAVPFLLAYAVVIIWAPRGFLDHAHPSLAWASEPFRQISFFSALYASMALSSQYWRMVSGDISGLVPHFLSHHRRMAMMLLTMTIMLFWLALWRCGASWSGALVIATLLALPGAGSGGVRWRQWRWIQLGMNLGGILLLLFFYMDRHAWMELGDLPMPWALTLAAILLIRIYGSFWFHPALSNSQQEQAEARLDREPGTPAVQGSATYRWRYRWRRWLSWMPAGWGNPLIVGGLATGALGTFIVACAVYGSIFLIAVIAMIIEREPFSLVTLQNMGFLFLLQGGLALGFYVGLRQGGWIERKADWRGLYLTGFWGGREAFCSNAYRCHLRHSALNSLALGVVSGLVCALWLRIPPVECIEWGTLVGFFALFLSYSGSLGMFLAKYSDTLRVIVLLLVWGFSFPVLNWIGEAVVNGKGVLNPYQGAALLTMIVLVVWAHDQAPKHLRRLDWGAD